MASQKKSGELYSPDYTLMVKAYGAKGERVEKAAQIKPALERAMSSNKT